MTDAALLLRRAMDAQRVTNPTMRAAIAAIAMGESALNPHSETTYAHTANARIRTIFRGRVASLSDPELDALKADQVAFFEHVYGGEWGRANLGNTEPGDGYKYRGRGFFQLTGRENYLSYGRLTGHPELVANPELANDPEIAAAIAVAYMKERYKGGGWEGMKSAVGNSVAGVGETKDRLFAQYMASGEFAAGAGLADDSGAHSRDSGNPPANPDPVPAAVRDLQTALAAVGLYKGKIDGAWGPRSESAMAAYRPRLTG